MATPNYEVKRELVMPDALRGQNGLTTMFLEGRKGIRQEDLWVIKALWGCIYNEDASALTIGEEMHGYEAGEIETTEPSTPGEAIAAADGWVRESSTWVPYFQPLDRDSNPVEYADYASEGISSAQFDLEADLILGQYIAVPTRALLRTY
jgi:hypothetical protein